MERKKKNEDLLIIYVGFLVLGLVLGIVISALFAMVFSK